MMFFSHEPIMERFKRLDTRLDEPMTAADLQKTEDCLVAITFRFSERVMLMRWGWKVIWKDHKPEVYRGFWTLDNSPSPVFDWYTYGTDWQVYRVNMPQDVSRIATKVPKVGEIS